MLSHISFHVLAIVLAISLPTWRVHDVHAVAVPEGRGGRTRDGDAPLLLLLHPVHRGLALVHLTDLLLTPRVVQDALRGRGLAYRCL